MIKKINLDLSSKLGLKKDEFKLAGVLILFNNLLQSLFKSQILTLGIVILGIFTMFFILFRNILISLIGVIPNFIAAFFIFRHNWFARNSTGYDDYYHCCNYYWYSCR